MTIARPLLKYGRLKNCEVTTQFGIPGTSVTASWPKNRTQLVRERSKRFHTMRWFDKTRSPAIARIADRTGCH